MKFTALNWSSIFLVSYFTKKRLWTLKKSYFLLANDFSWIPIATRISFISLTMHLFQTVRNIYETMGISPMKPNQQHGSFNFRMLSITSSIILLPISNLVFFLCMAQSRIEYVESFCLTITLPTCLINHVISFYEMANIRQLMEKLGEFIQRSKFHLFYKNKNSKLFVWKYPCFAEGSNDFALKSQYSDLNEKIERISKMIDFVMMKLLFPAFIVPAVMITVANYFIFDLKGESYFIPFSIW